MSETFAEREEDEGVREAQRLKNVLKRLGRWKDVRESGLWLSLFSVVGFMNQGIRLPVVSIISYILLIELVVLVVLQSYEGTLHAIGLIPKGVDLFDLLSRTEEFYQNEVRKVSRGLSTVVRNAIRSYLTMVESDENEKHVKFCIFVLAIGLVNSVLPLSSLVFLVGLSLFIFPVAYDRWHDPIETKLSQMYKSQSNFLNSLRNR